MRSTEAGDVVDLYVTNGTAGGVVVHVGSYTKQDLEALVTK